MSLSVPSNSPLLSLLLLLPILFPCHLLPSSLPPFPSFLRPLHLFFLPLPPSLLPSSLIPLGLKQELESVQQGPECNNAEYRIKKAQVTPYTLSPQQHHVVLYSIFKCSTTLPSSTFPLSLLPLPPPPSPSSFSPFHACKPYSPIRETSVLKCFNEWAGRVCMLFVLYTISLPISLPPPSPLLLPPTLPVSSTHSTLSLLVSSMR